VLEPDPLDEPPDHRGTADCDVAIDVAVPGHEKWQEAKALIESLAFEPNRRKSQFSWIHKCGLLVDSMPVPAGIEHGHREAIAFVRSFVERDAHSFYRGYELALVQFEVVSIKMDDGSTHSLRIAGLASLLAMKLQARLDRPHQRQKDAQDIGWLLRYLRTETVVRQLAAARSHRPALVAEVIERLCADFADADAQGVCEYARQAYNGVHDDYTERHRNALSTAVREVVRVYSNS
jgi:predicted nucleotidyltransferase